MFLKIYIKETQERIYIFKVKKLLFFLHLRIYQLFFFINVCFIVKLQQDADVIHM